MPAEVWPHVLRWAARAAAWLNARDPSGVPPGAWAGLLVLGAIVLGRFGGRLLTGLLQLALVGAAVIVAWQMVHRTAPLRTSVPPACAAACGLARPGGSAAAMVPLAAQGDSGQRGPA